MIKKLILYGLFLLPIGSNAQSLSRVLLIALDDRPPCLQFPIKMGEIADVQILSPPRSFLGRFTHFGKCDSILNWIQQQDFSHLDAAIVSLDMLAYGGLVASRVHETDVATALERIRIIEILRQKAPRLKIYGSSVIMRLAPTADGKNEHYREKLARWADLAPYPEHQTTIEQLEAQIPAEALHQYKKARARNLQINLAAITLVQKGALDYLILSQDDAKLKGVHLKERETLSEMVKNAQLAEKIAIQPGTDEVSMLLLARAISEKYAFHPKIKAIYSSDSMSLHAMPFEDRPLHKTVSFHIQAVGAEEVAEKDKADIIFYIYTSRFEKGAAATFAAHIDTKKAAILADIDPKGNVQGADTLFTQLLLEKSVLKDLYGYASWNTAGNSIGTALPQGILHAAARHSLKNLSSKQKKRIAKAQQWFTLHRLLDDYAYHALVRPKALTHIQKKQWNAFRLSDSQTQEIQTECLKLLKQYLKPILHTHRTKLSKLTFELPWNRTFEAEINFQ